MMGGKPILKQLHHHQAERTAFHGTASLGKAVEIIGKIKGGFHVLQLAGFWSGVKHEAAWMLDGRDGWALERGLLLTLMSAGRVYREGAEVAKGREAGTMKGALGNGSKRGGGEGRRILNFEF
jgi:hypothetical protein